MQALQPELHVKIVSYELFNNTEEFGRKTQQTPMKILLKNHKKLKPAKNVRTMGPFLLNAFIQLQHEAEIRLI